MGHVGFFPEGEGGAGTRRVEIGGTVHHDPWARAGRRPETTYRRSIRYLLFVRDGGVLSYGADAVDLFRRAATYVDRILRGEKPGDLPVQFPTKFEMVLNLKTAKALGLAIPPSILLRATEVIE